MKFFIVALAVVSLAVAAKAGEANARNDLKVLMNTALLQARVQFVAKAEQAGDQLETFIRFAEEKVENMKQGNRNINQACADIGREINEIDKQISATMVGIVQRIVPSYQRAVQSVLKYIDSPARK